MPYYTLKVALLHGQRATFRVFFVAVFGLFESRRRGVVRKLLCDSLLGIPLLWLRILDQNRLLSKILRCRARMENHFVRSAVGIAYTL